MHLKGGTLFGLVIAKRKDMRGYEGASQEEPGKKQVGLKVLKSGLPPERGVQKNRRRGGEGC